MKFHIVHIVGSVVIQLEEETYQAFCEAGHDCMLLLYLKKYEDKPPPQTQRENPSFPSFSVTSCHSEMIVDL